MELVTVNSAILEYTFWLEVCRPLMHMLDLNPFRAHVVCVESSPLSTCLRGGCVVHIQNRTAPARQVGGSGANVLKFLGGNVVPSGTFKLSQAFESDVFSSQSCSSLKLKLCKSVQGLTKVWFSSLWTKGCWDWENAPTVVGCIRAGSGSL